MLHFTPAKMIGIFVAVLFGVLLASPNILSQSTLDSLPDWMPKSAVSLGLDLQGGVHLQVKVQREDIAEERLENLLGDVRTLMRDRSNGPAFGFAHHPEDFPTVLHSLVSFTGRG